MILALADPPKKIAKEFWYAVGRFGLTAADIHLGYLDSPRLAKGGPWSIVLGIGRGTLDAHAGRPLSMEKEHGLVIDLVSAHYPDLLGLCVYHPAEDYTLFWQDLQALKRWLGGERPRGIQALQCGASAAYVSAGRDAVDVKGLSALDTETIRDNPDISSAVWDKPIGYSVSNKRGYAYWSERHVSAASATLEGPVVMHNALYDVPMAEKLGVELGLERHDTMLMAHFLSEPRVGLKPLAFRHLGMQMTDYSDMVGPIDLSRTLSYLEAVLSTYETTYQERISEKTGRVLKPKLLPAAPVYKAVARCLQAKDPVKSWRKQVVHYEQADTLAGYQLVAATLEDV